MTWLILIEWEIFKLNRYGIPAFLLLSPILPLVCGFSWLAKLVIGYLLHVHSLQVCKCDKRQHIRYDRCCLGYACVHGVPLCTWDKTKYKTPKPGKLWIANHQLNPQNWSSWISPGIKWSHYHHCARHWTYKMPLRHILSSVWVRLSIFSPLSLIQYVGLYVFSFPISLVIVEIIYVLCLIIIIKSEV